MRRTVQKPGRQSRRTEKGPRENHKDNQDWLKQLDQKLDDLGTAHAADSGKRDGARLLGMTIKDWLIVIIAGSALLANILKH
jgi:hypothetical protein